MVTSMASFVVEALCCGMLLASGRSYETCQDTCKMIEDIDYDVERKLRELEKLKEEVEKLKQDEDRLKEQYKKMLD